VQARKRFGQHFLVDPSVLDAIVRAIDPRPGQTIVEIGPGRGALTEGLIERAGHIVAVELDRDLAPRLKSRFGARLELIEADVLRVDFAAFGQGLRIVGNLPYNISTPLLFHLLPHAERVADQCFMLQAEVVERMVAERGAAYGRLSVTLQWRYAMRRVLDVPPSAFAPPPKVDSAVVTMRPRPAAEVEDIDPDVLGILTTAAFSQRRKLLRHTLGAWCEQLGATLPPGFDLRRRAEEVPLDEYLALARHVVDSKTAPAGAVDAGQGQIDMGGD
jgi:16S rRNA (adenine1518-N6/adenine1519-N6)-dimethyltransferase